MQTVDMTKIYKEYKGRWVALRAPGQTQVVAAGQTLQETLERARKKGVTQPLVAQIPKGVLPIVGHSVLK